MNANEIANKSFMELWDSYTSKKMECEDLREKICQQQLKIDNLLENNARLDAEIEALKSQSNSYKAITDTKIEATVVSYTHPVKELTDEEIIESLAELEHEQWMKWADTIMQTEKISDSRFARWASCMIPYAELSEKMKEHDRVWARQALAILRKAQEKC